ncbi:MAG: protein-L-isoaspartate O-methyltransferase, partial [Planctomycetes bacterium]|nr:protein-L-isoaspartate O-methyltransferase [Planctomycetota bacterium]
DRIMVTAAAPEVPQALLDQLAPGGRLVAPVGPRLSQKLVLVSRDASGEYSSRNLLDVIFVPLVGRQGCHEP